MSQQRITNRKLIILWATVVVAYVLLVVLMNPVLMMPEARQRAIFERASPLRPSSSQAIASSESGVKL